MFQIHPFPHGTIRQLTAGPALHPFSPAIDPLGQRVYFVRGASVWGLDLSSLREDCVVDFGDGSMGEPSISRDGEWMVTALKQGRGSGLAVGRTDGSHWQIIPFPRTVIHPQFHPFEPDWIEFAADPAPRMHRVRRDGAGMECLYEHGNDEFVVHETFLGNSGLLVFTVWPHAIRTLDWTSRQQRTVAELNAWHITPNRAGTEILCDTNHPDRGILIVDAATGVTNRVCLSEASGRGSQWKKSRYAVAADFEAARSGGAAAPVLSWMEAGADTVYGPQWTHPHPSYSPDEHSVVFASDRTGTPQVYVAEIPNYKIPRIASIS